MIANTATPYRIHVQSRIARELAGYELFTLFTHEIGSASWSLELPADINSVQFGPGQSSDDQFSLRHVFREWKKAGQIIAWLRLRKIQAVIVVGYNDIGRLRLIRWLSRRKIPVLLFGDSNIRGDSASGVKRILKRWWVGQVLSWCSAVLPCGRLGRDYFIKYGADPSRIFFFPYEPNYRLIESVEATQITGARQTFNLDPGRRRFVFGGRLVPEKRVDLLIDAFSRIAEDREDWDLIIVGDGPLREQLQHRVAPALVSRIKFLGFIDDQARLAATYKACDVFVLPSYYEPWALVINEAAAAGLALVTSDVVGASYELVSPGENGWTFARGNVAALAARLKQVSAPSVTDALRSRSPVILANWRQLADPINGLRLALAHVKAAEMEVTTAD